MQNGKLTMQFVAHGDFQREDHLGSCLNVYVLIFECPLGLGFCHYDVILKKLLLAHSDPLLVAIFTCSLSDYSTGLAF